MISLSGIISVIYRAFCLLFLHCFARLHRGYCLSKPLCHLSLTDMITLDLLVCYRCVIVASSTIDLVLNLGLHDGISPLMADVMCFLFAFSLHASLIYLSVIIIVRYLHVHRGSTSLAEWMDSDENACSAIRLIVVSLDCLLQGIRMLIPGKIPMYYDMTKEDKQSMSLLGVFMSHGLAATAFILNLALRLLILRHKRRANEVLLGKSENENNKWLLRHLLVTVFLLLPATTFLITFIVGRGDLVVYVYRHLGFAYVTILLPCASIMYNKNLRSFAISRFKRYFK